MVRKIEVTIPTYLRPQIEPALRGHKSVHHLCVIPCEKNVIFQFKVVNKKADEIIDRLTSYGIATSSKRGTVDVHALRTCKPRVTTLRGEKKSKRVYSYSDRLPFDEIEETIDGQLHLTFDYLALIVVGAMIAGVGLLTDSSVSVVASMLVSPLMGPILGMTFGFVIDKPSMYRKALRNELIGVLVCFVTGGILGFVSAPFVDPITSHTLGFGTNTQMSSRGDPANLIWGALIAIPSGMGVALGVASDQVSALIGVAISAALLPPVTNSGIALCISIVLYFQEKDMYYVNSYLEIGGVSMILFMMNWFLIFVFGIGTFRLKKVEKTHKRLDKLARFNEMTALPENSPDPPMKSTTNFGVPLLPSDYGSTAVVIGVGKEETLSQRTGTTSTGATPSAGASSKHKKSMTDFMIDNQALQGDNLFDTLETGNNRNNRNSSTNNNNNNYNNNSLGASGSGANGANRSKQQISPASQSQLRAIMESNTTVLERRLSDGVVGAGADWNASTAALKSKGSFGGTSTPSEGRLRHGSMGTALKRG